MSRNGGRGRPEGMASVLVVDDDPDIRLLVREHLAPSPRFEEVRTAASAEEALRLVERDPVDVILLDLRLPGMDGRSAIPHILTVAPKTMVVVLTVSPRDTVEEEVRAVGAFAFLEKLSALPRLRERLEQLYDRFLTALEGEEVAIPVRPRD